MVFCLRAEKNYQVCFCVIIELGFDFVWVVEIHMDFVCRFCVGGRNSHGFCMPILCGWPKLTWFLYAGGKTLGLSVNIEVGFVFVWVVEIDLIPLLGIELDLPSVYGSQLPWFWCGGQKGLGFILGIETKLVLAWGSKLAWFLCLGRNWLGLRGGSNVAWFQCRDRNWLGFSVGVDKDSGLVCGSKSTWFWCRGMKMDLILWWGLKLSWLRCRDRHRLRFCVGVEKCLVFVCWPLFTRFCCEHRTWLVFRVGGRNWLDSIVGGRTWIALSVWIGIDLVLVWGSERTLI